MVINMKEIKLWKSKLKDQCTYLNTIDDFINYLKQNNITCFNITDKYNYEDEPQLYLDSIARKQNLNITYTDNEHKAVIINLGMSQEVIINSSFYQEHQEQIIDRIKVNTLEQIKNKPNYIYISDILISDEFIDILINSPELSETSIYISTDINKNLTDEQIKKLQDNHLEVSINGTLISTNKIIKFYTLSNLKNITRLRIDENITERELENFIYLENNCQIKINPLDINDEQTYINSLINIFNVLKKHNRSYNIIIEINNRELLNQSKILNINNINLIIVNDLYDYSKEEYLKEEEQLDKLIKPIKEANLSPYEKYLAVYNIVKQFKPYKEHNDDPNQSRYLRYILNNEYMVCVGYSTLLKTLLDKVGIPCMKYSVSVDTSYDDGFTQEEIPVNIEGHARNIIKLDDPKYNIHGIYIVDATWDNDMEKDLYYNASMTFNRKKEAKRLERLNNEDLLLDFHNFEEFNEKLNYYLTSKYRSVKSISLNTTKRINIIKDAYFSAYNEILTILSILDYPKYKELYNKYDKLIFDNESDFTKLEQIYSQFLTEYAQYILPLSNKEISKDTLLKAAINTKSALNTYNIEQLTNLKENINSTYEAYENQLFPYTYDPNNPTPNYLEERPTSSKSK